MDVVAKESCRNGFDTVYCNGDIRQKLAKKNSSACRMGKSRGAFRHLKR